MAKHPPKTLKQREFVKEYIATGNATEAAARVYAVKSRASARAIGSENLAKLNITQLMDKYGLTDDRLVAILSEGLEATDLVVTGDQILTVSDHGVRHRYLKTALELKNHFPDKKTRPADDPNRNKITIKYKMGA